MNKEFRQAKYRLGRIDRLRRHIGPIEPLRRSSASFTGRGNRERIRSPCIR